MRRSLSILLLLFPLLTMSRQVPDSVVKQLKESREFRYANDPSYWVKPRPQDMSWADKLFLFLANSPTMKIIAYGIVVLIVLIIVYQVARLNGFSVFARSSRRKVTAKQDEAELSAEEIEEGLKDAISRGDYRMGTRLLYLKTLYQLHTDQQIQLRAKSTNRDYLQQMKGTSNYSEFARLTQIYEYVWYGEYVPGPAQFAIIRDYFNQFMTVH